MTTTDEASVGQRERVTGAGRRPSPSALQLSAAIRVGIAVLIAGGISAGAIMAGWGPLSAKSDVIGYPIFNDFNPSNYVHAYYLTLGLFPILAVLIFLGLTWLGPRVGLATPPPRGRLRPVVGHEATEPAQRSESAPSAARHGVAAARVTFVGAVLGLEVGVAFNHLWLSVVLVAIGYLLTIGIASLAISRRASQPSPANVWPATLNALGTSLTVAGLIVVSAHTEVRILSDHTVHHYQWFPAWVGLPLAAAMLAWLVMGLRHQGSERAAKIERRSVLLVAAPVALFVVIAHLPGDLGQIGLFEEGQLVTETTLLGHGWLPWRDVILAHGLVGDIAPTAVGWGLFGNSYWAAYAGNTLILLPLTVVVTYWLLAYLVGSSWPLIAISALMFVGTWLGTTDAIFISWWVILMLFAALLKRPTRVRGVGLGVLAVAQAIATFELAPATLVIVIAIAAYDWYSWSPGTPFARAFARTIWVVAGVITAAAAFMIYMAGRGALGDVVSVSLDLIGGHFAQGIPPSPSGAPRAQLDFIALAPVVALLIAFAYAVVRLRLRRPFLLADWPMGAAALFALIYYSKFLARMDLGHAYEAFITTSPLIIYIVYRALTAGERWIRGRIPERRPGWVTAHPLALALMVVFLVGFWGPVHTMIEGAPAAHRPAATAPPAYARAGYASQFDAPAVQDLRRIVNAYLGPHDRLMDITNEPALFYYFLGREPSSRWFAPDGLVDTAKLQRNLLAELRRSPPKLIVFDDTDTKMYGLEAMDGVPAPVFSYLVSRWILTHYRPLLVSHNRTIYALPGARPVSSLHLELNQRPATTDVRFRGQECLWGDSPGFLTGPALPSSAAQSVGVRTTVVRSAQVTVTGWAGDLLARKPAREVVATFNGKVVGRATPRLARPDVTAAGYPAGFAHSGFRLSLPTSVTSSRGLRVFAIARDGAISELAVPNGLAAGTTATLGRRTVVLQQTSGAGSVDTVTPSGAVQALDPPAGTAWSAYRWLEITPVATGGFTPGRYAVSNRAGTTAPGRLISFNTLARSPRRYVIPVSSCQQWHGYGSRRLYLTTPVRQQPVAVKLIR